MPAFTVKIKITLIILIKINTPVIVGDRDEKRMGEDLSKKIMKVIGFLIPARYKMIEGKTIAKAMVKMANEPAKETRVPSEKIKEIAKKYK